MNLKDMPKIELHCHLDGCLRVGTVIDLVKKENLKVESLEYDFIKNELAVLEDCPSLVEYLKKFELPLKVMQTKENLERIAYELIEDAKEENIKYIEVRFAPILHMEKGLTIKEIIGSVIKGLDRGFRDFNVRSNLILSILRHMPSNLADIVIEEGREFIGKGVVALDLAGAENKGFCKDFEKAFEKGRSYGYRVTIHAGETGFEENIVDAINILKAERIGHGIAMKNNKEIIDLVVKKNVLVEMCPKSNVQTKAIKEYREHPLKNYMKAGVLATLCTDNRTVSNVTLTEEYKNSKEINNVTVEELKKLYINGVAGAFCTREEKEVLIKYL